MITVPRPDVIENLVTIVDEIIRRAPDVTVLPIIIDYSNQRIIIGANAASAAPAKVEITGDLKIIGAGNGLILPTRNGNNYGRIILENPDSNGNIVISCDPL